MKPTHSLIILAGGLLLAGNAQAASYTFEDTWKNWNNEGPLNAKLADTDQHGSPRVSKIIANTSSDNRYLESVVIQLTSTDYLNFNSLFINTNYDGTTRTWDSWDYFVHAGGNDHYQNTIAGDGSVKPGDGSVIPGNGFYTVNSAFIYTKAIDGNGWDTRDGNPNGIMSKSLYDRQDFLPTLFNKTLTYDFTRLSVFGKGLAIDNGFFLAWTPWCANDVIGGGAEVPEPATMLLFGTGLVGLAGAARRKRK